MTYRRVTNPTEIVVIFQTHLRPGADIEAYQRVSRRMHELAETIPGFISIKSYTSDDGDEFDLVRFETEASLEMWRNHPEHREAQRRGREKFYDRFWVQTCKVVREYEFRHEEAPAGRPEPEP